MGKEFYNLTDEELCELMCGGPEDDGEEQFEECDKVDRRGNTRTAGRAELSE